MERVALHVAPEAAVGGPLALVPQRRPDRVGRRSRALRFVSPRGNPLPDDGPSGSHPLRQHVDGGGCTAERVLQANLGADLDFC